MPATPPTSSFTCTTCGAAFDLPASVLERYPGWVPKTCLACRDGGASRSDGSRGGSAGGRKPKGGRSAGGLSGGGRGRGKALVEENLTLAEVLERYRDGPQDGVFTDGSAVPNPGPGGWGAVYVAGGEVVEQRHGHEPRTTNNRMELTALIQAYDMIPAGEAATVYTDSNLAVRTINEWAAGWQRRGWKRKAGEIQNLDLVQELYALATARPDVELRWIRAHAGSRWNEYADSLATAWMRDQL